MTKALTYSGFAISTIILVLVFVTAKTYTQLAIAVIIYPLLAYLALKLLPHNANNHPSADVVPVTHKAHIEKASPSKESVEIADIDKRTFLKLIGSAGLSFFIFSILGRGVENLLFGVNSTSKLSALSAPPEDSIGTTSLQTTEGYKISEIDEGVVTYYGFVNRTGGWLIMKEETENNAFRYAKGDTSFPSNWNKRAILKYDYYHNLF